MKIIVFNLHTFLLFVYHQYSVPTILQVVTPISILKKVIKENFKNLPTPSAQGGERYVTYSSFFSSSSLKAWRFLSRPFPACA